MPRSDRPAGNSRSRPSSQFMPLPLRTPRLQCRRNAYMNILKAHLRSVTEFLDRYLPDLPTGGLFIPTRKPMTIGESVVVSLRLGPRSSTVLMRGSVAWRRPGKHRTKIQAGIGIEFLETESKT